MGQKTKPWLQIFTIILSLSVFLLWVGLVTAWGEEPGVFNAEETAVSSSCDPKLEDCIIRKRPYLIYNGNNTSMTVLWQTFHTPSQSTIEWGTTENYGEGPYTVFENSESSNEHQFSYTISKLSPGTRYYYRVTNRGINHTYSHEGSFITGPPHGQNTLSFYAYGDTRAGYLTGPGDHNNVLKALLHDLGGDPGTGTRQTLLVHLGDYVYHGLNELMWDIQQFNLDPQYDAMHKTFALLPFMGVLGNHEGYDARAVNQFSTNYQNIGELFRKYYPYQYPNKDRFYYSFDYGPVHFVVIDTWSYQSEFPDQQTIGKDHEKWLKQDLKASKKPWKIAMLHTPIWDCREGKDPMKEQLTPILKQGGVHLILQGHVHYYSRVETEGEYAGMTYLTLGGGGADLEREEGCVDQPNKKIKWVAIKFHFARFDISGNTMTVTVIDNDGKEVEPPFQLTNLNN